MTEPQASAETELKFALAIEDIPAFASLPFLAGIKGTRTAFWTTYFDTEDFALRKAGYSLRLRRSGGSIIQTLKGPSDQGRSGLFSRAEHEHTVSGDALDRAAIAAILPAPLLAAIGDRLGPRFDYQVERQAWAVPMPDGTVNVSVDHGIVEAGSRTAIVAEAEFETLSGNLRDLGTLARAALDAVALHVEPMTKAERGYRLATGALDEAGAEDAAVQGGTLEALRAQASILTRSTALARRAVAETGGVEEIHALRVSLRRLRVLVDIVDAVADRPILAASGRTARHAFRRLGAVRDLDLVIAALPDESEDLDMVRQRLAFLRSEALLRARRAIEGRRFARGLFAVLAFASGIMEEEEDGAVPGSPLHQTIARLLDRRWKAVRKAGTPLKLGARERHTLRKSAKRLRYTAELGQELLHDGSDGASNGLNPSATTDFEHELKQLQSHLGLLNDRATIRMIGRRALGGSLARTLGLGRGGDADARDLKAADKSYRRLVERVAYWR